MKKCRDDRLRVLKIKIKAMCEDLLKKPSFSSIGA